MNNFLSKLTSRKFWIAIISTFAGIAELFGAGGELVSVIVGSALALLPSLIYIITEGKIDAASAKKLAEDVESKVDDILNE
jgi:pheromone shutdown protein TraB